jgi:hypothetical protein
VLVEKGMDSKVVSGNSAYEVHELQKNNAERAVIRPELHGSHGFRNKFTGDTWIHFSNSYFEFYMFFY